MMGKTYSKRMPSPFDNDGDVEIRITKRKIVKKPTRKQLEEDLNDGYESNYPDYDREPE